jgi:hypothetical protein
MAFDVRYRPDLNFDTYAQAVKLQPNSHSKHKNSYSSTAVAALLISPPAPSIDFRFITQFYHVL